MNMVVSVDWHLDKLRNFVALSGAESAESEWKVAAHGSFGSWHPGQWKVAAVSDLGESVGWSASESGWGRGEVCWTTKRHRRHPFPDFSAIGWIHGISAECQISLCWFQAIQQKLPGRNFSGSCMWFCTEEYQEFERVERGRRGGNSQPESGSAEFGTSWNWRWNSTLCSSHFTAILETCSPDTACCSREGDLGCDMQRWGTHQTWRSWRFWCLQNCWHVTSSKFGCE